jgi:hypothetical protein
MGDATSEVGRNKTYHQDLWDKADDEEDDNNLEFDENSEDIVNTGYKASDEGNYIVGGVDPNDDEPW